MKLNTVLHAEPQIPGNSELAKAIVANPNDFQAQYLGAIFYIQRQIDAAREHSDRAITLQPDSFLDRYELAHVEIVQGKRPRGILKPRSMPRPIGSRHA
jgi:hypothetical protein